MKRDEIPEDLEWLARNVSERPHGFGAIYRAGETCMQLMHAIDHDDFTKPQWRQARHALGLESPEVTEAEDEAWEAMEEKQKRSKYHREIKPGVFVDVYDVLKAFDVRNPALQHLLKKALAAGQRGHKDLAQDMDDIVASAIRARELAE